MLRFVLLCAILVAPWMAVAEDAEIDEVLVTATRRTVSSEDVSSSLTLITAEDTQRHKLVTEALAGTVGAYLQQTTPGQGAPVIRGLKGSSVLHLVDGLRLNNAIFRSAPTQYFALVPVSSVERVEIVRGTLTSLYGNDAVGGVVQLITRVPEFAAEETQFAAEAFVAFDSAELGKTARATLDAGNRELAATFSAEFLDTGDRRTGGGARIGPSGYESRAARFALSVTPDDDRSWLLDVHYLEQPETPRVDELVPGFGQTQPDSSEFFFAPNRRVFVHGRYSHADGLAGLDWNADLSWQRIDDDRRTRGFQSTERRYEANSSDLYGLALSGSRTHTLGSWIAGAEFYHDTVSSSRSETSLLTGAVQALAPRFPDGSQVRQAAVYANTQRLFAGRHNVSGGLRVSNDDVSLAATAVSSAARIDSTDISGDVGYIFEFSDRWHWVANVGLGFRSPNVFDLGTLGNRPGNRFNIPNTSLDSEHVTQFDIGARYRGDLLRLELALYTLRYDDRITSVGTGDVTPDGRDVVQAVNAAESTIRGVEAGLDVRVTEDLNARAVLNYTWGEQRISGGDNEPADRIPPLNGSVELTHDAGGAWRVAAWARFAAEQDRLSARDIRDSRIDPLGTGGWVSLGARVEWLPDTNWQLSLGVDNLLDERYRVHGSGLDAPGRGVSISARRTWY